MGAIRAPWGMKRSHGTGTLYVKWGSYYARWVAPDGSRRNRRVGKVRSRGDKDGLTRSEAERRLRRLIESEADRPRVVERIPTVDEAAMALRERLAVEGVRPS